MDIWTVVLSSLVVSGIVSALVGGWFNLRSKRDEYANLYYEMILERRLAAYEEVERLIGAIKVAVIDDDQKPYHMLFSKDDGHVDVYQQLHGTIPNALWLTDELFELTRQLNFRWLTEDTRVMVSNIEQEHTDIFRLKFLIKERIYV